MRHRFLVSSIFASFIALTSLSAYAHDGHSGHGSGGHGNNGTSAVTVDTPLDVTLGQLPESITAGQDGYIYLAMANQVWRVRPGGHDTPRVFVTLPVDPSIFTAGLKFDERGNLYAITSGFNPALDPSHVWQISRRGVIREYAHFDANGFPNDLAFDDDGNLYVTDATFGQIYKVPPGGGSWRVWLDDPSLKGNVANPLLVIRWFGADGLAFDRDKRNLYIGNLDYGRILQVPVHRGQAGNVRVFAEDPRLVGADGLTFDTAGNLYVAVNAQNQIARLDRRGRISIVASGGVLDSPSSFAWGDSNCGGDATLYVSNFAIGKALGLVPGVPTPSLGKLTVPNPGIPLP